VHDLATGVICQLGEVSHRSTDRHLQPSSKGATAIHRKHDMRMKRLPVASFFGLKHILKHTKASSANIVNGRGWNTKTYEDIPDQAHALGFLMAPNQNGTCA